MCCIRIQIQFMLLPITQFLKPRTTLGKVPELNKVYTSPSNFHRSYIFGKLYSAFICKIELGSRFKIIISRFFIYSNVLQEGESLYCAEITGVLPLLLLLIIVAIKTHPKISTMLPGRKGGQHHPYGDSQILMLLFSERFPYMKLGGGKKKTLTCPIETRVWVLRFT